MDELEKSLKYVPTYLVIEQIRKEEKRIAKEKLAIERDKTKSAKIFLVSSNTKIIKYRKGK